eukprot:6187301-Pyramimonas_sp.AAC.1
MACNLCGETYVSDKQARRRHDVYFSCNHWGAVLSVRNDLSTRLLAQTSHPPICNLVCKSHSAAIAMSTRRWLVRLCGRASLRARAQRPPSLARPTRPRWR